MSSPDPPSAKAEQLADSLRTSLRRQRFRPRLIALAVLTLALLGLAALAWWVYRDRGETPPLKLLALDTLVNDVQTPRVRARLVGADLDAPPANRARQEVVFQDVPAGERAGAALRQEKTATDADGFAVLDWPLPPGTSRAEFRARYIDARQRKGDQDNGRLFAWPKGSTLLLLDVEGVLAEVPRAPRRSPLPPELIPLAGPDTALERLKDEVRVIYLTARAETWQLCRHRRSWVEKRFAAGPSLPAGPIWGRADFAAASDAAEVRQAAVELLRHHFDGPLLAMHSDAAAVPVYQKLDVPSLWFGAAEPPAELPRAQRWADVPGAVRIVRGKK
jgi:hypothetical protein